MPLMSLPATIILRGAIVGGTFRSVGSAKRRSAPSTYTWGYADSVGICRICGAEKGLD
jgi:hypothetical protein